MDTAALHSWNVTPQEAVQIQKRLQAQISLEDFSGPIHFIAGCDMSLRDDLNLGVAGIIIYSFPELREVERRHVTGKLSFPYVPGLLSFREAPVLIELFGRLEHSPDLIIFDGQGIAHPRGVGIASHMGLWLNKPSIGCAKSRLFGIYEEPGEKAGSFSELLSPEGGRVGTVLRTREKCRPVYISPGHKMSIERSVEIIGRCMDGYRIPKPTREADRYVGEIKRSVLK